MDKNVDKKGTRAVAEEYLNSLYSEEAQHIIGKNFYRPTSTKAQAKCARQLPRLILFTIDQAFGGWDKAAEDHFADGAAFDQIHEKKAPGKGLKRRGRAHRPLPRLRRLNTPATGARPFAR